MLIVRCAWHRGNFGWSLVKGVTQWRPLWPIRWSDGLCDVCLARLRARRGPALLGRVVAAIVGRAPTFSRRSPGRGRRPPPSAAAAVPGSFPRGGARAPSSPAGAERLRRSAETRNPGSTTSPDTTTTLSATGIRRRTDE